jgi:glycosyltransferase involved in cell wall biosynthesis
MRVVLVEPYYGGSHRAWADGYQAHSAHDVSVISHPARFWKWRMHGAFLTLAEELERHVSEAGVPDVIVVSTMMDVASFAGAIRHIAAGIPIVAYFHESQFTYPLSPADRVDQTYAMKNWASAVTADLVVFNSEYHREVFRTEATALLNSFPEYKHVDRVDAVVNASVVVPVGVELGDIGDPVRPESQPPLVVWNHRWEHDKGPHELLAIVQGLVDAEIEFQLAMCGEVFVSVPPTFAAVVEVAGDRLVHQGWADRGEYVDLLGRSSVVLSTALQEFFGIGVVEGIAAGARPVLPRRLVYPERVDSLGGDRSSVLYESPQRAVELIVDALEQVPDPALMAAARRYGWSSVAPQLDAAIESARST